jgi:hypothetical protein
LGLIYQRRTKEAIPDGGADKLADKIKGKEK